MKLALVGSLVVASLLVGCNESGMSASNRPDVAPYMGADNGYMAKGWKPGDQASWNAELLSAISLSRNTAASMR